MFFHYLLYIDYYDEKRYFSRTIALLIWSKICMEAPFSLCATFRTNIYIFSTFTCKGYNNINL